MSNVTTDAEITEPHFGNAWRAKAGTIHATVYLNRNSTTALWFDSADDARALIAECAKAAEGLDRLAAESDKGETGDGG